MKQLPIILAAGKGTRMRSELPKVLHPIGGKPMLKHVVDACAESGMSHVAIVYGHGGDKVKAELDSYAQNPASDVELSWVLQAEQKGTGHAVAQANDLIEDDAVVVIAYGDVPLITAPTLNALSDATAESSLVVLTTIVDNPFGYGRIVRNEQGQIEAIIEEKDADDTIRQIKEVNTGFIAAKGVDLKRWLQQLTPDNAQREYYLTDCIGLAAQEGHLVSAVVCDDHYEVQGVNDRIQQAELERAYQDRQTKALMVQGATLLDPSRVDIRGQVEVGNDVTIDVNVIFQGQVKLGHGVMIESGCVLTDCELGDGVVVHANSIIESAIVADNCDIGPYARLRPGAELKSRAKVGNFVEIKKSVIGVGSKVNHLTYIGDTEMGEDVNIGAGTITCNYDGAFKHKTVIGDRVFVGSSSQLVAPVNIGDGATIGAGSTITKNVPSDELTLARAKQVTLKGWVRPVKNK